jgi:hypothetical protein
MTDPTPDSVSQIGLPRFSIWAQPSGLTTLAPRFPLDPDVSRLRSVSRGTARDSGDGIS